METIRGVTVPANYGTFEHLFELCEIGVDVEGCIATSGIAYDTLLALCGIPIMRIDGIAYMNVSADSWRDWLQRAKDIVQGDRRNAEILEQYAASIETINGYPDLYEVGKTYKTLDGKWITVLRSFKNTVLGDDGKHRYNTGLDCGRVTGTPFDYSCGDNFERTYKRREELALKATQYEHRIRDLEAQVEYHKSEKYALRDALKSCNTLLSAEQNNCKALREALERSDGLIYKERQEVTTLENALDQCKAAGQERIQEHESVLRTWKEHVERVEQANVRLRNQVTELKCASANMNSTSPTPMTFGLDAFLEKLESARYDAVKAACCEDNPTAMATVGNGAVADSIYEPLYQEHLAQGVVLETVKGQLKQALKTKQFFADRVKTRRNAYLRLRRELRSILRELPPCRFKDEVNAAIDAADDAQRPTGSMS